MDRQAWQYLKLASWICGWSQGMTVLKMEDGSSFQGDLDCELGSFTVPGKEANPIAVLRLPSETKATNQPHLPRVEGDHSPSSGTANVLQDAKDKD